MSVTLPAPGWAAAMRSPMGPHMAPPACGEDEALRSAHRLAARLTGDGVDGSALFAASGLGMITVGSIWGGSNLSYETIAHVVRIIASASRSTGEAVRHHLALVASVGLVATPAQQGLFLPMVSRGLRFGPPVGNRDRGGVQFADESDPVPVPGPDHFDQDDDLADLLPVSVRDAQDRPWYAIVERSALEDRGRGEVLHVPRTHLLPIWKASAPDTVQPLEAIRLLLRASAEAGHAGQAVADRIATLRGAGKAGPAAIEGVGDLRLQLDAALALLEKAGRAIDRALIRPTANSVALAHVGAAGAQILTADLVRQADTTGSNRHRTSWRHDPARSRYAPLGEFYLSGTAPAFS